MYLSEEAKARFNNLCEGKELVAYGCGIEGLNLLKKLMVFDSIKYIIDDDPNKINSTFMGKSVFGKEKLMENTENIEIIVTSIYYHDIKRTLSEAKVYRCHSIYDFFYNEKDDFVLNENKEAIKRNLEKITKTLKLFNDDKSKNIFEKIIEMRQEKICQYSQIAEPNQYFPNIITDKLTQEEVFLDLGVYDGVTIQTFINKVGNKFNKVIGFEADKVSFDKLKNIKRFINEKRIEIFPYAVYSDNILVPFIIEKTHSTSKVSEIGDVEKVKAIRLDDFIKEPVTFIKLDIEGSEFDALLGAKELIKHYKPKLAVSIYHKTSDLWEIPLLINDFMPEYKFYVRHHSVIESETVLYALT